MCVWEHWSVPEVLGEAVTVNEDVSVLFRPENGNSWIVTRVASRDCPEHEMKWFDVKILFLFISKLPLLLQVAS